jgi:hypothetical protein
VRGTFAFGAAVAAAAISAAALAPLAGCASHARAGGAGATSAASAPATPASSAATTMSAPVQNTPNTLKLAPGAAPPKATLADAAMLIGHWRGEFLGATAEELWLAPAGGAMAGIFRLVEKDTVQFYELMTVVEEEGSIAMKLKHFHANLHGWEEKDKLVTFRLVRAGANELCFEGLTFRRLPDGSLEGYVALGKKDGTPKEERFVYRRVAAK